MADMSPFPNLPGRFQSGPFALSLNKFHGREQISLIYKDELVLRLSAEDIVDLDNIVRRMAAFLTEENFAKLPPDEG